MRLTYSLSVTNKAWKHYKLQVMKFLYWHSTYTLYILNKGVNMICAKLINSCVCARLTLFLY